MSVATCHEAAVAYASAGLSVLPWRYIDGGKRPTVRWGELQQRRWSVAEADAWWSGRGAADAVGVVTGAISDLVVLDCDDDDAAAWALDALPPTPWMVRTGRGLHLGYGHPGARVGNRTRIGGLALDLRGDGGYVAMPPSRHRSGAIYRWVGDGDHRSPRPTFSASWLPAPPRPAAWSVPPPAAPGSAECMRRGEAWMRHREPAIEGCGGHDHTRATAWALARMGLAWDQAWPLLAAWNATCLPPWPDDELARLLLSALAKGDT